MNANFTTVQHTYRRYRAILFIICCLVFATSLQTQAQLTLTNGQSATLNTTVSYSSASITGANTTLSVGSSGNVSITGGFYWVDQPAYISIASGGSLTIGGDFQGDGNTGTNNNYYPCINTSGLTAQAMIIDCKGSLTVNGNLAAGSATKRFKNWVFLHIDSGATVTLNGNDNVLGPRGIIYVHKGGKLIVNGTNLLVEYAYSRIEIESGGTMSAVNLTVNGNGSAAVTSACSTNPSPYNGNATTTNPPYTSLNVNGTLNVSGNLNIDDASVSTSAMTAGTGHFTVGSSGTVTVAGNFMNGSAPTTTGSDTATISGTLTVTGNATNNSILNIDSNGVMNVNGSTGLSNNTGSIYKVSVINVDGKLNVAANTTNNGLININSTGFVKVNGNLLNNTISTFGVAIITVINDLYVKGNIVSNDIIRAICPAGDTAAYVGWSGTWTSNAHDTVQNYSTGVKYYMGTQVPPGHALNLCSGNMALLSAVLASSLLSFTVEQAGSATNVLNWQAVTQQLPMTFVVQRSADGNLYTDAGTVTATGGNNTYTYTDRLPSTGTWYYRLKIEMPDGSEQYSKIVIVRYQEDFPAASLRPSVTSQSQITLFVTVPATDRLSLLVTDVEGRTLLRRTMPAEQGDNIFTLGIPLLHTGIYYVQVTGSSGLHKTLMFQKR